MNRLWDSLYKTVTWENQMGIKQYAFQSLISNLIIFSCSAYFGLPPRATASDRYNKPQGYFRKRSSNSKQLTAVECPPPQNTPHGAYLAVEHYRLPKAPLLSQNLQIECQDPRLEVLKSTRIQMLRQCNS